MKNVDEAIGRVLAGIREATPAPGFEGRIELRVREAARRSAPLVWLRSSRYTLSGLALGGIVAAVLLIAGRLHRPSTVAAPPHRGFARRVEPSSRFDKEPAVPDLVGGSKGQPLLRPGRPTDVPRSAHSVKLVSFPAPPMPLTEQERLLLRVAHRAGPEEVAMLDRVAQEVRTWEDTAAFEEFFGKPERVDQTKQQINQGETR